jgi:hypothetical protein
MTCHEAGASIAPDTTGGGPDDMQATSGPIEVLGVEFDGRARFEGRIADELDRLQRESCVRVLAVLFVHKGRPGEFEALDLETGAGDEFTDVFAGNGGAAAHSRVLDTLGLSLDDVHEMAEDLQPGTSAGVILMEHLWARELHEAIRGIHGTPFLQGFLTRDAAARNGG